MRGHTDILFCTFVVCCDERQVPEKRERSELVIDVTTIEIMARTSQQNLSTRRVCLFPLLTPRSLILL